jgi:hypothetical protein
MNLVSKFSHLLVQLANKSKLNCQHSAIIVQGGKLLSYGVNCHGDMNSSHAEEQAVNNLLKHGRYFSYLAKEKSCFLQE